VIINANGKNNILQALDSSRALVHVTSIQPNIFSRHTKIKVVAIQLKRKGNISHKFFCEQNALKYIRKQSRALTIHLSMRENQGMRRIAVLEGTVIIQLSMTCYYYPYVNYNGTGDCCMYWKLISNQL
jgi:AAA15 family ATPase/GTPase